MSRIDLFNMLSDDCIGLILARVPCLPMMRITRRLNKLVVESAAYKFWRDYKKGDEYLYGTVLMFEYFKCVSHKIYRVAGAGNLPLLKFMLGRASPRRLDYCLRYAAKSGNLEMVQYLVERGADPRTNEYHPVRAAIRTGDLAIVKYFMEMGPGISLNKALSIACARGKLHIMDYLTELGADMDDPLVLLSACVFGQVRAVQHLMDNGVRYEESSLLITAVTSRRIQLLEYVLNLATDVHFSNGYLFYCACRFSSVKVARYLIEKGFDIRKSGEELLEWVRNEGSDQMRELFTDYMLI